jgi:hypothetical protein
MPKVDTGHLHTADDIAAERARLMSWREHMETVNGGIGFKTWRVFSALVESAITARAVELGLETLG